MYSVQQISPDELQLVRIAMECGALSIGGSLSRDEQRLATLAGALEKPCRSEVHQTKLQIRKAHDPLGERLLAIRSKAERRLTGTFYTPQPIVDVMIRAVLADRPSRVIDVGCGSGRFSVAAHTTDKRLEIIAIDIDPVATILTRGAMATIGAENVTVVNADYTQTSIQPGDERTAFISNPPYVRHHSLHNGTKAWAIRAGKELGIGVSALSGLHVHFLLATALLARHGDVGCFITSSEWLDVRYGSAVREVLLGQLGLRSIDVVAPNANPFADVMSTACITRFSVGQSNRRIRLRQVADMAALTQLGQGRTVDVARLSESTRWSALLRDGQPRGGGSPLGDVFQVHRGLVTGANRHFVMSKSEARLLGLNKWAHSAITSAEEILRSDGVIRDSSDRKVVIAVPREAHRDRIPAIEEFLRSGEHSNGMPAISERYVPSHRSPWWFLGRLPRPPIVATYMARRAPKFALNPDGLVILNIAHGLYPREIISEEDLSMLANGLNRLGDEFKGMGRTYQGGLEKFEPREMEALLLNGAVGDWIKKSLPSRPSGA